MNRTQVFLGFVLLIVLLTVVAFALNEIIPNLMASVGWHDICSVGWNG